MKLLVYAGGFAPVGGIETFLHGLALGLRSRGVEAQLLCWGPRSGLLEDLRSSGVPARRQAWRWGCRWAWPDRLLLPAGEAALRETDVALFGKLSGALVHRQLMRVKALNGGPPFVLVTPYRPAEMWATRAPEDDVLNSFDAIVVQAECFAEDLRSLGYRGRIRVLPYLPPACSALALLPACPPLRVGFLGRLAPQKNLPLLLRAFAALSRSEQAALHLFGDGAERVTLEKFACQLGIGASVRFHGSVPHEAVAAAIDSSHLFAFTSLTEGQPVAALEILARGRPIVATPVGVFPELLSDPAFGALAPAGNAEAFAEVLQRTGTAIAGGQVRPEDIQRAYAERYPRERVLDQYADLFQALAARACAVG